MERYMFWRHEIRVPPGFEVVVNGSIDDSRPLYVGWYDQVYFVSFAPYYPEVSSEAPCKEGIRHRIDLKVKLELQRDNLADSLRDAGYSTYRRPIEVSALELVVRQNLLDWIEACVQAYIHETGFFHLIDRERVRQALHQRINSRCAKAQLNGEVISCAVVRAVPKPSLLSQLAAMGRSDSNLQAVIEHLLEEIRQGELVQVETERAKANAELARVQAQEQIALARANVKIAELAQENRIAAHQAELQEEDAKRQQAAQERNAGIKENGAAYEFAYKSARLEEEMVLAQKEVEIAEVKDLEEAALRERKRLDMQLEAERERELAAVRAEEKERMSASLGGLLEKLAGIPTIDYTGVRTLITGAGSGGTDSTEFATGLVLALLSRAADGMGMPGEPAQSERALVPES
jgi:hypothetical protein